MVGHSHSATWTAKLNHVPQPAVAQATAKLTQTSGHALFRRSPQGLFMTEAGAMLYSRAARALQRLGGAMAEMDHASAFQAIWQQLAALTTVSQTESFTLAACRLRLPRPIEDIAQERLLDGKVVLVAP